MRINVLNSRPLGINAMDILGGLGFHNKTGNEYIKLWNTG
jgi:hypothetical protein